MLRAPEFRVGKVMGNAEIREVFKIPSIGTIAAVISPKEKSTGMMMSVLFAMAS